MTDHELEQRLRAWYRAEVGDERAPSTLRDSLAEVTDVAPRGLTLDRRTFVLLAAAAMLAAAAIGSALAIGSGLIRPPWQDDDSLSTIYAAGSCEPALADGLVLTFQADERPSLNDLPRYVVFEDRRALRLDPSATAFDVPPSAERKGWSQRTLTSEGLEDLLAAARAIDAADCEPIYIGESGYQEYFLTTRTGEGVAQVVFGIGTLQTGASDLAAMAAAAALARQLADPDLGLPPTDWIDSDWLPWVAERYIVTTQFYSSNGVPSSIGWDVVLPDGSTPRTFGETVPGLEDPRILMWRCGIVGADEAKAIVAAFDAAGMVVTFFVPETSADLDFGDGGGLHMEAVVLDQFDCQSHARALGYSATPEDIATPDPEVADVSVCDLVAGDSRWNQSVREPWSLSSEWSACRQVQAVDDVFLRMRATSATEALELVRLEFGQDGYVSDTIAGRTIYINECVHSAIPCSSAIAISADPYYVVMRVNETLRPVDLEARLRELAAVVIHNLED
jgi:hypothetical protein